ncbi:MAG: DUF4180 domain-containing protein [Bacteroidales bacterium]|nr:DUF4180 domain-containing protein [Bacteroidales bacterium]MBN2818931.1 DUF4180 domain-containing protein [Bacteroidales bacterium]
MFNFHTTNESSIAELSDKNLILEDVSDFVDLLGNAGFQGANGIIIHKSNLKPEFFDLKTGIAGEILQKFSNYNQRLAIVGDFSQYKSKSLQDFIRESNRIGRITFVSNIEMVLEKHLNKYSL